MTKLPCCLLCQVDQGRIAAELNYINQKEDNKMLPLILVALIGSATVFGVKKAIEAHPINDETLDLNTHAKLMLEVADSELNTARSAALESMLKLDNARREMWQGPMARLYELFSQIIHVDFAEAKVAFSEDQLETIRVHIGRPQDIMLDKSGNEIFQSNTADLPNNLYLPSLGSFLELVFSPAMARTRLAEAEENLAWAEEADEKMTVTTNKLWDIQETVDSLRDSIARLEPVLTEALDGLEKAIMVGGIDFQQYAIENKKTVYQAVELAHVILMLITAKVVNDNGEFHPEHSQALADSRRILESLDVRT